MTYTTGRVSKSCVRAKPTAFSCPVKKPGSGRPAMLPMETYISGARKANETHRRMRMFFSCACIGFCTGAPPGFAAGPAARPSAGDAP